MKNTAKFISAAGLFCMMAGSAWADLNAGLVAHYPFNGNAQDVSGNGNHGTEHGKVSYLEGKLGQAASFNGSSYVSIPKIPGLTNKSLAGFTVSLWTKLPKGISGTNQLIEGHTSSPGRGEIYIEGNTSQGFAVSGSSTLTFSLAVEKWVHLVGVYDSNTQIHKMYVNGETKTKTKSSNKHLTITTGFNVGRDYEGSSQYFRGQIDGIRLYKRALSADEVKQLYTKTDIKPPCQLDVAAKLQEKQLEPDDNAIYRLTVTQTASCCTAKNVVAKVTLTGKPEGITLKPNSLKFGTLKPKQSVHKDLRVATKKAKPGKEASFSIDFDYECVYPERGKDHKDFVIEVAED
jgi:hypothetical protein